MIYKVMSVYDVKAEAYMRPFFARSTGEGLRSFSDEVNSGNKESALSHHPEDFILMELGDWDELSGELKVLEKPRTINRGIDVLRKTEAVVKAV